MNGKDAAAQAGVTYRQWDFWSTRGYLGPRLATGAGSGNASRVREAEVARARIMGELVRGLGLTPEAASRVAEAMVERSVDVVTSGAWILLRREELAEVVRAGGDPRIRVGER